MDIAFAASLSNLCFLRLWAGAPPLASAEILSLLKTPPRLPYYLAAFVNVCFGAAVIWAALQLSRSGARRRQIPATVFLIGSVFCALNSMHVLFARHILRYSRSIGAGPMWLRALAVAVTVYLIVQHARARMGIIHRLGRTVVCMLLPLVPMNIAGGLWASFQDRNSGWLDEPGAGFLPGRMAKRVVWIVFDEWDQRLTFDDPEAAMPLQAMQRLRNEGVYASQATSPGRATVLSFAGLTTGRLADRVDVEGPDRFVIRYRDGRTANWKDEATIFRRVRALGINAAIAGWGIPHCRLYGREAADCSWAEWTVRRPAPDAAFLASMRLQFEELFDTTSLPFFTANHAAMLKSACRLAGDARVGMVLLHLPDTHWPYIYDARRGAFGAPNNTLSGYRNSLALADLTLGRIRAAIEAAGLSDTTSMIVSSDHALRYGEGFTGSFDARVPFLLKLAGRSEHEDLTAPFSTVITSDLIVEILTGRITTHSEAAAWIRRQPF